MNYIAFVKPYHLTWKLAKERGLLAIEAFTDKTADDMKDFRDAMAADAKDAVILEDWDQNNVS